MKRQQKIAIAMSGGVDSSVAAALLVEQGYDVFGLMLRLWSPHPDQRNRCCSPEDVELSRNIAAALDIPFYVLDVREEFKKQVVDPFIDGYAQGITPNPCLFCNLHIRWGFLLQKALAMGASHFATGHYARIEKRTNGYVLLRAVDDTKDQSYVLSVLGQHELSQTLLPLGNFTKNEVRQTARKRGLSVAERMDSQDLCFVMNGDYRHFLHQQGATLPPPGPIIDRNGHHLGDHRGLANYTIGQRRGIGISKPFPLYVLEKDIAANTLVVGPWQDSGRQSFIAGPVSWIGGNPSQLPIQAQVRVRYKAREVSGVIEPDKSGFAKVVLGEPLPDVTPGQLAVFYDGDLCLGGGIIQP